MDMSTADRTKFEIFKKLVTTGPNTAYGLFTALEKDNEMRWRQSTVHRIVKFLEKQQSIVIYSEKTDTGRAGKVYGPTLSGLYFLALEDESLLNEIEDVFGKWLEHPEFSKREEIVNYFGKEMLENERARAKMLFKTLCQYSVKMIKLWRDYKPQMTLVDEITVGELIAAGDDPEAYLKFQKTLYDELPGYKKRVDSTKQQQIQVHDYLAK